MTFCALRCNPEEDPQKALGFLARVIIVAQDAQSTTLYKEKSILEITLDAFESHAIAHGFEVYEEPKQFIEKMKALEIYQSAVSLLLLNIPDNPSNNPIIALIDTEN